MPMRISTIKVKNLFDLYNHEINLNVKDHITIIYGQNGVGKTIILEMIKSLFSSDYKIFFLVPYEEFSIEFDDGKVICLKRIKVDLSQTIDESVAEPGKKDDLLVISLNDDEQSQIKIERKNFGKNLYNKIMEVPGIMPFDHERWFYRPTGEVISADEAISRFGLEFEEKNNEQWFTDFKNSTNVNLIKTQRLLRFKQRLDSGAPSSIVENTVNDYSKELSRTIQEKLAEYASLSQSLDRTFPIRLAEKTDDLGIEKLKAKLSYQEERRAKLIKTGLLDPEGEIDFKYLSRLSQENAQVLSVFTEDVEKKLDVFNELSKKIDLFVDIINTRFVNKSISINKTKGFIFTSSNGKNILPINLSSGEQHELILYYELLFRIKENSLILIDEPEISLHIEWQRAFLKDLHKVIELVDLDALIATHSPDIVYNRFDLTVQLISEPQVQLISEPQREVSGILDS